ncbi:MAG: transporter [Verrucomicrobiaceae bacterium]|nr:transporter [Verrucomicrobiaceae bacterium]
MRTFLVALCHSGIALAEVRELSTDRPDQTESPYSVPKGMFQLEMDFGTLTRDTDGNVVTETINLAPFNLKYGLGEHTDLQFVFDNWSQETQRIGRTKIVTQGMGDLTVRLKQNLWGNDSGSTALAVMPFVTVPLNASDLGRDQAEAGLIVPFGWNLPNGFYLGLMTEWDWLNDENGGHKNAWFNTITLGADITSKLACYAEFTATVFDNGDPWQGTVDGGLTYALKDNVQLDLGCNFGITRSAPDFQPFVGITLRY